jgi:hypothetical protein
MNPRSRNILHVVERVPPEEPRMPGTIRRMKRRNQEETSDESLLGGLARPRRCRTQRKRPFQKLQHRAAGGAVVFV